MVRVNEDGSQQQKTVPDPVIFFQNLSPDGKWIVVRVGVTQEETSSALLAYPAGGGSPQRICNDCSVKWSPDGKLLYFWLVGTMNVTPEAKKTYVVALRPGMSLPPLPAAGIKSLAELTRLPAAGAINMQNIYPGPSVGVYAFTKSSVHNNLYRIPVP